MPQISTNLPPEFVEPLQTRNKVDFSTTKKVQFVIGKLADFENDPFTVEFAGTELFPFFRPSFDKQSGSIILDVDMTAVKDGTIAPGDYTITIAVNDSLNTQLFDFTVEITGIVDDKGIELPAFEEPIPEEEEEIDKDLKRPKLKIKSISRFGVV